MKQKVTAVFDIGKTNKKFFLFDKDFKEVHKEYIMFDEIVDEDGHATENLSALQKWLKDVFQSEIGVRENRLLAQRPNNLRQTLDSDNEFPRFPVLFDHRIKTAQTPAKIRPHLQVAFIGRFCGEDQASLCSASDEIRQNETNFNSADIMFLIDGTKSMKKYFSLVSTAVKNFTKSYIDDPDYRFGVAMYGDFKDKYKTKTGDTIDFKVVNKLQINFGDIFSRLDKTKLFIKDVMKDK